MNEEVNIQKVKQFWEENPLFSGETKHEVGSTEYYEEHRKVYIKDVFAGSFPEEKLIPDLLDGAKVLDLGCGAGFWTIEIKQRRPQVELYAADLTKKAIELTKRRLGLYKLTAKLSTQNAETMAFESNYFDHINCQGVVHHTPSPESAIAEIARVLKSGGTASISVYYRNFFLRNWNLLSPVGKLLSLLGARFKGRGRENIFKEKDIDKITRLYDGDKNPIGLSYDKDQAQALVKKYFEVEDSFLFFFPARTLPIPLPKFLHRWMAKQFGFMIHLNLRKK